MASEAGRDPRRLFVALFFLSGAAGLADQVVWLRYLSLVFGNTTLAAATLVAVFLGGLGAGAWWFARRLSSTRWSGVSRFTAYAVLEAAIGLFAIASPYFFDMMDAVYVATYRVAGGVPWVFALLRVLLAAICLLPPTFLMGGTLPVLLDAVRSGRGRFRGPGADTALFYGANTSGAVAGVALAGFFTIRLFGLHTTLLLSAAVNLLVALAVMVFSSATRKAVGEKAPPIAPLKTITGVTPVQGDARFLLTSAFAMGAMSIACEVLWTRVLVFYLGSSVYAFSLMLLLFLLGIACGSFAAGRVADRVERPLRLLAWVEVAIALTAPLTIALFATTNARQIALSESLEPQQFSTVLLAQLLAVAPILLPPTLLMGFSFPLLVRAYERRPASLGAALGEVYGANTAGSILGAFAAGFVLVPAIGSQNALLLVGAGNAALALALGRKSLAREGGARRLLPASAAAVVALLAVVAVALPPDRVILAAGLFARDQPGDLAYFHEDASAAVAVRRKVENARPWLSLELNGVNVAGTSPDLYAVQKMQGHLPLLLGGTDSARVVHIGFGSGGTAHAVSRHPVAGIRIVEISPAVLAASDRWFADINEGVLHDPRVQVEINDGRNFLLATAENFDAVLSDSIHPRYAGNGSLYSEEYFRLVDARLVPGGVVSMWLPMYSLSPANFAMILRAFTDVFPQAAVWYEPSALNSFTVVTAHKGDSPWDGEALVRGFARPAVRAALDDIGIRSPADLLAGVLLSGEALEHYLEGILPHVDDRPAVEYESGTILAGNWSWRQNFERLLDFRPAEAPADVLAALPESERGPFATAWKARGEILSAHRAYLAANVTPWK